MEENMNKESIEDPNARHPNYPIGIRFKPHDEEVINDYLLKKVRNLPLSAHGIVDVDIYNFNPQKLAELYPPYGVNEWYFFTSRVRKYPNGEKPNRAAGDGYWKATGADKPIQQNNDTVGSKKTLVFYMGKPPKGEKTNWIMHEFRALDAPRPQGDNKMMLDTWVLCRIYNKNFERLSSRFSSGGQDDEVQIDSPQSNPSAPIAVNAATTTQMIDHQVIPVQTQTTPATRILNNVGFSRQFGSEDTHMVTTFPTLTTQQRNDMDGGGYYNEDQTGYYSEFDTLFPINNQGNQSVSLPYSFIDTQNWELPLINPKWSRQ